MGQRSFIIKVIIGSILIGIAVAANYCQLCRNHVACRPKRVSIWAWFPSSISALLLCFIPDNEFILFICRWTIFSIVIFDTEIEKFVNSRCSPTKKGFGARCGNQRSIVPLKLAQQKQILQIHDGLRSLVASGLLKGYAPAKRMGHLVKHLNSKKLVTQNA